MKHTLLQQELGRRSVGDLLVQRVCSHALLELMGGGAVLLAY